MLPLDVMWCLFFGLFCAGGAAAWFGDPRNIGARWWACCAWAAGTVAVAFAAASLLAAVLIPI